jgi:hypothetical protein
MRVLDHLLKAVRAAAVFNPEVQVAPACILWPDRDRQWESIIPLLKSELPEMLVLGDYNPEERTGPAIWLRCVMAGKVEEVILPAGSTPILYLPGISRQDLRAIESCPDRLKPLAELQYRGVIWSQVNAKDWTILAFLKSDQGGLGLDVAQDTETKQAMQLALSHVVDEQVSLLHGKRLDQDFFNTLLTGGDPTRDLLQWLDQGDAFRQGRSANEWQAFVQVCKSQLAFDPENAGILVGGSKLASRQGPWRAIWERFCEAPKRYATVTSLLRQCQPPAFDLFSDADSVGGWPQWNDEQEVSLRQDLSALGNCPAHEARAKILELEQRHRARRDLVWAELGEAPLATAMQYVAILADATQQSLAAGDLTDLTGGYRTRGWQADDAALQALAVSARDEDVKAISTAIRAVYLPWLEESARYLQKLWQQEHPKPNLADISDSGPLCLLFVDGLRYDCALRLAKTLEQQGLNVAHKEVWAALPSVTGTCKPAIAPMIRKDVIAEEPEPYNFEPLTSYQFKKALEHNGWSILDKKSPAPTVTSIEPPRLWAECGDLDHEGHDRGWKLARHLDSLLIEIQERVTALLATGWQTVRIITDHGWLLLPGGLPKVDLPKSVTETKWGRCAVVKPGAATNAMEFPWYWNTHQMFALAEGVSCFRSGEEYTHGGISLQECLLLELTVTSGTGDRASHKVSLTDIAWKGLRCTIAADGEFEGLAVDVRTQPGNPGSSIVVSPKIIKKNGTASVVVENEELEGDPATVVLLDENGGLMAQMATVVGGGGA